MSSHENDKARIEEYVPAVEAVQASGDRYGISGRRNIPAALDPPCDRRHFLFAVELVFAVHLFDDFLGDVEVGMRVHHFA